MEDRSRALLLKFPGTNCDRETARALRTVGFTTSVLNPGEVERDAVFSSDVIVFSGGFSYGDYVKAGRLAKLEIKRRFGDLFDEYAREGGFLLGICNGFQILLELDLLPEGSLVQNDTQRFMCKWVNLRRNAPNEYFLKELPERFELPIANMEGRFVAPEGKSKEYLNRDLVPLIYDENPNGSHGSIAALQNETGRIMGMMPHPERFLKPEHHYDPNWNKDENWGWGYYFFQSLHQSIRSEQPEEVTA